MFYNNIRTNLIKFVSGLTALMVLINGVFILPLNVLAADDTAPIATVSVNTNSPDGTYTISKLDGSPFGDGAGVSAKQFDLPASDGLGTFYQIVFGNVSGYQTPATIYFGMVIGQAPISHTGEYTILSDGPTGPVAKIGTVNVSTNSLDGTYTIKKLDGTLVGTGGGVDAKQFDIPASDGLGTGYQIIFGDVSGYTTPAIIYFNLSTGNSLPFTGVYVADNAAPTQKQGTVNVSTNSLDATYSISKLDDTLVGTGGGVNPKQFDIPASDGTGTGYKIAFSNVAGYKTPETIYFNLITNATLNYSGFYSPTNAGPSQQQGTVNVSTNNLDATYTITKLDNTLVGTGGGVNVKQFDIPASDGLGTGYKITFSNVTGYITPATIYLNLATGNILNFVGTYNAIGSIGTVIVNQIGANGTVDLGGPSSTTIITNATYTNGNADPGNYTLPQILPPAGFILDTVTTGGATPVTLNVPYTQTLNANGIITYNITYRSTPIVCVSNCGGGGGGGGSGTYYIYTDDLKLNVVKLVSVDGGEYVDASTKEKGLVIPDNATSTLSFKVSITNPNGVAVKNVEFDPAFDAGLSGMKIGPIDRLSGLQTTRDIYGKILVNDIFSNQTVTFIYQRAVTTKAKNQNPAVESIKLANYMATTNVQQSGLKKTTKGKVYPTYLYTEKPAGKTTSNADEALSIKVTADKTAANIGDTVNYTVTATNVSGGDITGLDLAHSYPAELDMITTGGGTDNGREIHWKRPIIRDGETITYKFSAKVTTGVAGQKVRSITRALVNEYENISPVETFLTILGNGQNPDMHLAETGPMGMLALLILSIIAAFGYTTIRKKKVM